MGMVLTDPKHELTPEQEVAIATDLANRALRKHDAELAFRYAVDLAMAAGVSKMELVRIVARGQ
jgi:hypothetical protein